MKEKEFPSDNNPLVCIEEARVRFNETDPLGIVWHGHYIVYFEDGREAFGRQHGLTYLDIQNSGFTTPIVKTSTEHYLPLKYGETFSIETTYINSTAAKLIYQYRIFNEDLKWVCKGQTTQVFLDGDGNLCLYAPEFFQNWKEKMGLV